MLIKSDLTSNLDLTSATHPIRHSSSSLGKPPIAFSISTHLYAFIYRFVAGPLGVVLASTKQQLIVCHLTHYYFDV